ncbi:hypothetical protein LOK49_LG15G00600 [Camellia lanceoleosa]|uniref:Uncharacterized protein n=1 Tax=Camellia lanceoleosa TaxID=1840588 RepID=A0ACC0F223_9ERIC|nr:hypothetical protein LOK49_LG15G00600 [Camellia lanceoleosa]
MHFHPSSRRPLLKAIHELLQSALMIKTLNSVVQLDSITTNNSVMHKQISYMIYLSIDTKIVNGSTLTIAHERHNNVY